ncbi:MAG: hypothetical protein HZB76_05905 [Chlamydiae bacterium]|nr:hypothetical protein [Chlamydiota bacterium]
MIIFEKCPSFLNCIDPISCWSSAFSSCAAALCLRATAVLLFSGGDYIYSGVVHSHSVSIRNNKDSALLVVGIVCLAFGALALSMTQKFVKITINNVSIMSAECARSRAGYAAIV